MNKAFVREPDSDVRVPCPRCGAPGTAVGNGPLQTYVPAERRSQFLDAALYCGNAACEVAYFNMFEQFLKVGELTSAVYPYDLNVAICPCFGFSVEDVEADAEAPEPLRIRELLAKSKTSEARCSTLAIDGQCCLKEVQRLFMKLRNDRR